MIVDGTNIYMTRGDTESITVKVTNNDGSVAPLLPGDTVYLTIKENINTVEKVLQFTITEFTDGMAVINILPATTKQIEYGVYVYDVQVTKADGTVRTIVRPSTFEIGGEVTYE